MASKLEVRGVFYRMLKEVFPHIEEIVGEGIGKHFEGIDPDAWYDAGPYLVAVDYLRERISPQVMVLIGNRLVEVIEAEIRDFDIGSPREVAEKLPEIYRGFVRGEGAGDWHTEEYAPGRAVIVETGVTGNVSFAAGVLKSSVEAVGAYNVRVTVLDERAKGAAANRYLLEWMTSAEKP